MLVQGLRVSLQQSFREGSQTYLRTLPGSGELVRQEMHDLNFEIQTLWDEVVPVAHIAIEKEYLQPVLEKIDMRTEQEKKFRDAVVVYVSDRGCYLILPTNRT